MLEAQKEGIRRVLSNVAEANQLGQSSRQVADNMGNFLRWLSMKLPSKEKRDQFILSLEAARVGWDFYLFSYAIKNPGHFADKLIETLES